MTCDWDKELKRYPKMVIDSTLPERFPEKYGERLWEQWTSAWSKNIS